jgi:hypothetical protein
MTRTFRLARHLWAIALFLAFGVAQAESLVCAEEQRLELVADHQAELKAPSTDAPASETVHCCPCVHTFVSTERRIAGVVALPSVSSAYLFHPQAPSDLSTAPLLPPPIA